MYKIYWTNPDNNLPYSTDRVDLADALKTCEIVRNSGVTFVTMVSENTNLVGKPGVAGVEDGILPDGSEYDWTKNDRVGQAGRH